MKNLEDDIQKIEISIRELELEKERKEVELRAIKRYRLSLPKNIALVLQEAEGEKLKTKEIAQRLLNEGLYKEYDEKHLVSKVAGYFATIKKRNNIPEWLGYDDSGFKHLYWHKED